MTTRSINGRPYEVFEQGLTGPLVVEDNDGAPLAPGWYWWPCHPGCLPDCDSARGPYSDERAAWHAAEDEEAEMEAQNSAARIAQQKVARDEAQAQVDKKDCYEVIIPPRPPSDEPDAEKEIGIVKWVAADTIEQVQAKYPDAQSVMLLKDHHPPLFVIDEVLP